MAIMKDKRKVKDTLIENKEHAHRKIQQRDKEKEAEQLKLKKKSREFFNVILFKKSPILALPIPLK